MMQSQKTYRVSCAGALRPWGTHRSSASCDGQDGRFFSCEKVLLWTGLLHDACSEFGGNILGACGRFSHDIKEENGDDKTKAHVRNRTRDGRIGLDGRGKCR